MSVKGAFAKIVKVSCLRVWSSVVWESRYLGIKMCMGIERVAVWGSCGRRQLQRVAVAA